MLPETLKNILNSTAYPEYDICIQTLDISNDSLNLQFIVRDTEGSTGETPILMTSFGSGDFYIDSQGSSSHIRMEDENPLLWRFTDIQSELYISGDQPNRIERTLFDLLTVHNSLFARYLPFDLQFLEVLNTGAGLLKKGPKKLLTEFAKSLNMNGIKTSVIDQIMPGKVQSDLRILFLGHSYIIAEKFDFELIP